MIDSTFIEYSRSALYPVHKVTVITVLDYHAQVIVTVIPRCYEIQVCVHKNAMLITGICCDIAPQSYINGVYLC